MEQNNIIVSIAMGVGALITSVISIFVSGKNKKAVKALPEAEAKNEELSAELEIEHKTINLITEAEAMFKDMNTFMKNTGNGSAGGLKKNYVLTGLKTFCLERGFGWNDEKMNEVMENLIAFTKNVNAVK